MTVTVTLSGEDPERDLEALLRMMRDGRSPVWIKATKQIAALLQATSQRAFRDQRFGTDVWPPRYPNQESSPFVNVAGVLADLNRGLNPPKRRFERRPALRDTGEMLRRLRGSSAVTLGDFQITLRSDVPYADKHQTGGKSIQPVTSAAREGLAKMLRRPKRLRGKDRRKLSGKDRDTADRIAGLRSRLGFLFQVDQLETEIAKRPFIGVTDETKPKIVRTVEHNLGGKPWLT